MLLEVVLCQHSSAGAISLSFNSFICSCPASGQSANEPKWDKLATKLKQLNKITNG